MKNEELLLELLKEVRDDTKGNGEKLSKQGEELARQSTCLESLEEDMKEVRTDLSKNTADVAEHVRRSNLLEVLHMDNQKRIETLETDVKKKDDRIKKLERPEIAKAWVRENLKWLLTISGLTTSLVTKLLGLW